MLLFPIRKYIYHLFSHTAARKLMTTTNLESNCISPSLIKEGWGGFVIFIFTVYFNYLPYILSEKTPKCLGH